MTTKMDIPKVVTSIHNKPENFKGADFKTWQNKMLFYLTTLGLERFLGEDEPKPADGQTPETHKDAFAAVDAWRHSDFLCRNYILNCLNEVLYKVVGLEFIADSGAVTMFRWRHSNNQENDTTQRDVKINELKASIGPLSGSSLQYCTDACVRRYLEARNWNVDKSKKMLEESLNWRLAFKPEEIRWHDIANEGETGKVYRADFHDRNGRTVLILRPGKQNTSGADNQLRHLVYLIENAILNLPDGQEQMAWLIDFTGWSLSVNVPIKTARDSINILQNHYPERLGVAFLYNPPRIFEAFWKIVKYFLDTKTFQKVKFVYPNNKDSVELMSSYFDVENLPVEFGGKAKLQYDHEEFSRLMAQDDVKAVNMWRSNNKLDHAENGYSNAEVAPEPVLSAPAAC